MKKERGTNFILNMVFGYVKKKTCTQYIYDYKQSIDH